MIPSNARALTDRIAHKANCRESPAICLTYLGNGHHMNMNCQRNKNDDRGVVRGLLSLLLSGKFLSADYLHYDRCDKCLDQSCDEQKRKNPP